MPQLWSGTRRSVFRFAIALVLGGAARRLFAFHNRSPLAEIALRRTGNPINAQFRRYRVNATVMIGSVPIFSKQDVGGACLLIEEDACRECTVTCLQFAAGSWPDRLKGFNRFGVSREAVREENGAVVESAYLSCMASCVEKNFGEARQAFAEAQASLPFTIARGRSTVTGCASQIEHRTAPAKYSWSNCFDLADQWDWQQDLPPETPADRFPGQALPTFLFALRHAIQTDCTTATPYIHNSKVHHLRTRRHSDPQSNELAIAGWVSSPGEPRETEFKLWMPQPDGTALPNRIEFRPRGFLKLTLEHDAKQNGPVLRSLFQQEQ